MTRVTIHVAGGIAAYKAVSLLRLFQKNGDDVRVAMTESATKFVTPATFEALTKQPVLTDLWSPAQKAKIAHIELADWTELAIVVPATANTIAKMAGGIADNAVSSTLLATDAPKLVVPAMNSHMWANEATQRNIAQLKNDRVNVIPPETGHLAEGYEGTGRMPAIDTIFNMAQVILQSDDRLVDKKILVTAGGTQEDIDPVRFIGNHSSGKMGIAIANAAAQAGASVTLIAGQVKNLVTLDSRILVTRVTSTDDMAQAVKHDFTDVDALVMAAAVADFQPITRADQKIKKNPDSDELTLRLRKTPDILKQVGQIKRHQFVVGFAAETQNLLQNANKKLIQKNADIIVANNVSNPGVGFGSDDNQVTILTRNHEPEKWPKMSKQLVAQKIIDLISDQIL